MTKESAPENINIAGLKIERLIGQGGMARVYLAEQKSLGRKVAVKVLDPRHADPEFANRFLLEAKLVATLNHSSIITIYDFGTLDDGKLYISMEYLSGGDLEQKISNGIDEEAALKVLTQLARGLNFIHKKNIIHRDIKPANILFRQDGSLVLTDFGIAKQVNKNVAAANNVAMTQVGTTVGSPAYSSPEQAQGNPLDHRTDIYSVGVVVLEMLTGVNPYKSDTSINTAIKHIQMPIPVLKGKIARYQPIIEKMLAKKPRDRFSSMQEVLDFLDKLTGATATTTVASSATTVAQTSSPLIDTCTEDSKIFSVVMWRVFQETITQKLDELLAASKNNAQQWQLLGASRDFRKKCADLNRGFQKQVGEGFRDYARGEYRVDKTFQTDDIRKTGKFTLVGNDELERNIAASTLIRQVETKYAEELNLLHARLCHLTQRNLPLEACPVGPYQFAHHFKEVIQPLQLEKQTVPLFFKMLEKTLLSQLGDFYKAQNKKLADAGVLPKLTFADLHKSQQPSIVSNQSYADSGLDNFIDAEINKLEQNAFVDVAQTIVPTLPNAPLPGKAHHQQLFNAIQHMQQNNFVVPGGDWVPVGGAATLQQGPVYSRNDIVTALSGLQGNTRSTGAHQIVNSTVTSGRNAVAALQDMQPGKLQPYPLQALDAVVDAVACVFPDEGDEPKQLSENDANMIDLVGLIFEYMLQDEHLPDSVKALLSYLQVPYVKVALLDPELFSRPDHPARLLFDKLSEAGALWLNKEGHGQFRVFDEIKSVVNRILADYHEGNELFEYLLAEFSDFVLKIKQRIEQLEKLSTQRAVAEQHLQKVKARVHSRVTTHLKGEQIPAPIVAMLLYPWFDYLTSIALRYGEKSEQWNQAFQVIDVLLWSIKPKSSQHELHRLDNVREYLVKQIQRGFDIIGYDQAKGQDILNKIAELQNLAVKNNKEALKVTEQDRVEIIRMVKELTVREQILQAPSAVDMTEDEKLLVEKMRLIEFGTWLEFREKSTAEPQKLKVAWINNDNQSYMLVNSTGKQVSTVTALELARRMIAKTASIIAGSAKPFFERALEAIYRNMAAASSVRANI